MVVRESIQPSGDARRTELNAERWVLLATVLASGMAFIDTTALNVALPAIQSQVHATGTELFWIVNAYAVVAAALILFGGALGDGFGRKRVFAIGIGLFVAASVGCGLSFSTRSLIIARSMQGLGAALMIPGSLSLISTVVKPSRRGRAIGIWSACSVVMTALGPIIGGLLADAGWWRAVFFINLPIGIASLGVLMNKVIVDDHGVRSASIDYAGAFYCVIGLAGVNFACLEVASRGWSDSMVVAAFVIGILFLAAFFRNQSRSASPLLPLDLFRSRNFSAASQLTVCFYSGLYGMLFFLSLNLIQVQNYGALAAGAAQLPVMLLVIVLSPLSGKFVDRYGPRIPLVTGGSFASLGFFLLARPGVTQGVADYWVSFFPPLLLLGAGMGIAAAPLSTTIMNSVPPSRVGIASGINSTLSRLSSVLGVAMLGPIAILTFRRSLSLRMTSLSLSDEWIDDLRRESWRLADAVPPSGMSATLIDAVQHGIDVAYVDAFRVVSWVAASVLGASTLIAAALLERKTADV